MTDDAPVRDVTTAFARALVDEWARSGVRHAALAPGSRSAPLALALAADDRIRLHVHLDERSAAFFALGTAKASGQPAVVVCTSGTAAANFHPAVVEAHHARVPLIVCTADRPPELRDTGAGQTIDQHGLFGGTVRWRFDPGPPDDHLGAGDEWRAVAARAVAEALGPPGGPVHLNLPFREPLVPTGAPLVDAPGRAGGAPWTTVARPQRVPDRETVERLVDAIGKSRRGILVAGWGAHVPSALVTEFTRAAGWPVLADPLSGVRSGPNAVSMYDAMLRVEEFAASHRPDLVLRLGAPVTSKATNRWLGRDVEQWVVDPDRAWLDPQRAATHVLAVDGAALLGAVAGSLGPPAPTAWLEGWYEAERRARRAVDATLDGSEELFEGRIARDVVAALPSDSTLMVASSMPVRDVEAFAAPRDGLQVLANRGVNGIDGFTSTVLGVAAATNGPVAALVGDLCFLHDSNALLGAAQRGLDATFVVIDNDGGGIFSFLPQAESAHAEHFETLFGTPHGIDLAALAAVHQIPVVEAEKADQLVPALLHAQEAGGVRVVLARTDRAENVLAHREALTAVAAAIAG